jgi:RNA polymerase sigma factor (TIGR02999 family)
MGPGDPERHVDVTGLLRAWRRGDAEAANRVFELVYQELRGMAHRRLRRGRPGGELATTALVHEVYLKLADQTRADYQDRGHLLAVAARAMRQVMVDLARRHSSQKRGGGAVPITLEPGKMALEERAAEVVAVDEALARLEELDPRLARVVELRFFGGLSVEESAEALDVSPRTVKRDWQKARAFLYRELTRAPDR